MLELYPDVIIGRAVVSSFILPLEPVHAVSLSETASVTLPLLIPIYRH